MSFFDDKQEVIKLELTTYGRYLISKGKLKPVYYAFFDDDIIYDGLYADISESQNSIQMRIQDETVVLKPQTTFSGVENSIGKNKNLTIDEIEELKAEEEQLSSDKNFALSLPLGNSSNTSEYAPSWKLNLLKGTINNVEKYIDNSNGDKGTLQPYLKIPQVFLNDVYGDVRIKKNDNTLDDGYISLNTKTIGSDTYYVSYKESEIIIDIIEENTHDENINFDIEMFIEEKNDFQETFWKKLCFNKPVEQIKDRFLLDIVETPKIMDNENFSEYYLDSTSDLEIDMVEFVGEKASATYQSNVKPEDGPFGEDC